VNLTENNSRWTQKYEQFLENSVVLALLSLKIMFVLCLYYFDFKTNLRLMYKIDDDIFKFQLVYFSFRKHCINMYTYNRKQ